MAAPTIGKLSSMYLHAWKSGLKTTYYLRSRPATRIQQATVAVARPSTDPDETAVGLLAGEPREPARPASDRRDRADRRHACCSTPAWT